MDEWTKHRDELYERVVRRGRALQWRRRALSGVSVAAVILVGAGFFATRPNGETRVISEPRATVTSPPSTVPAPTTSTSLRPATTTTTTTTSPATTTTTTTAPTVPVDRISGTWERHGTILQITPDGRATMTWRLYRTCGQDPPPCDRWVGNLIYSGGQATLRLQMVDAHTASGTVLTTSVPSSLPLGPIHVSVDENSDLLYLDPFPGLAEPFCGPRAIGDQRCGA